MPSEAPGVWSPYVTHVHPYPTRFHGGSWRRPVFGFPAVRQVHSVSLPSQFSPAPGPNLPQLKSLGSLGGPAWETGDGIYRHPRAGGGGIFNTAISGPEDMKTDANVPGAAAVSPSAAAAPDSLSPSVGMLLALGIGAVAVGLFAATLLPVRRRA